MPLRKVNRCWNYKTLELRPLMGPDYLEKLGNLLDEAGKNGWELAHMNDSFMILKQLFVQED
jgi:hypothetical protein